MKKFLIIILILELLIIFGVVTYYIMNDDYLVEEYKCEGKDCYFPDDSYEPIPLL